MTTDPFTALVWLRFHGGAPIAEIAAETGRPADAVEAALRERVREITRLATPGTLTHAERTEIAARALAHAAAHFGLRRETVARARRSACVRARWAAWLAVARLGWPLNAVARAFGVDHTSVRYAVEMAPPELTPLIETIAETLRSPHGAYDGASSAPTAAP